jgi:glucosamine--fructose-6-phosphate aminotransferase (isomerizing)
MCGIVGYTGPRDTKSILLDGLRRLEYRGYDSSGVAFNGYVAEEKIHDDIFVAKAKGRISNLEKSLGQVSHAFDGAAGIAHTRWATHGEPSEANAHPHFDNEYNIAVVHNGIIDNYKTLRDKLTAEGVQFTSETDTEVIPHLIASFRRAGCDEVTSVRRTLELLRGTYGLAVIFRGGADLIVAARNGSPLVIGVGAGENFVASDVQAIAKHTNRVIFLDDGEIAAITRFNVEVSRLDGGAANPDIQKIDDIYAAEDLGSFEHFMQKEIFEQPESISRCFGGRVRPEDGICKLGGINLSPTELATLTSINIIACGTSYHAGLVGASVIERVARVPCRVEVASEFLSRSPIIDRSGLYIAVSQSGETYDTLECIKEIQLKGGRVLGIVNVVGSSIARLCGAGVYIHAGPEIAVASTKAFTSQVAALLMFAVTLGRSRDVNVNLGRVLCHDLKKVPEKIEAYLKAWDKMAKNLACRVIADSEYVLFLGRGVSYPVALEGALKLKEISYIPCEAYAAGEMKHGPIAMISKGTPVIVVCPMDSQRTHTISNIREVKARGATVIAVMEDCDSEVAALADYHIPIPKVNEFYTPLVTVVPLQMLAYHTAAFLQRDIDKPRNLAKSVTVS